MRICTLWIHGHKHNDIDAMINTKLISSDGLSRKIKKRVGGYRQNHDLAQQIDESLQLTLDSGFILAGLRLFRSL